MTNSIAPATGTRAVRAYLEMIKFEHSIFALPFAMLGMIWAANGWPGWRVFGLIVLAMVSCRSAAMAFNRILDRDIDAKNPRTLARAIPAGILQLRQVNLFLLASCALFFAASALLNPLTLALSPVALAITLFYSATKRFTPLCHFVLGLSLGIAPAASWIAVTGSLTWTVIPVVGAVLCWTAGFDIIYALQDEEFDRTTGLRSMPETVGKSRALLISRITHTVAIGLLALAGILAHTGPIYFVGVGVSAALLVYEQSLVSPRDLSKVNLAFFTLNGFVSIGVFVFALVDLLARRT